KKLDFVLANNFGNNVSVCLGKGDGTFQPAVSYPSGTNSYSVTAADLNGDGKLDLVVANNGSAVAGDGSVAVLLGKGDGTFQPAQYYFAGSDPVFVTAGDLNGDGKLDLAVRST